MESAQAFAKEMETVDENGRCRMCCNVEDDCNRYAPWCLGRTSRASKDNEGHRSEFVEQLTEVVSRGSGW
jgi:hypothetical protein